MGKLSQALEKKLTSIPLSPSAEPHPQPTQEGKQATLRKDADEHYANSIKWSAYDHWDPRLQLSTDPHSPFFEAFRRLRTPILYPSSGKPSKTILVTSVVPHEGKGFICANLGIALAQGMEHHALMLDCDFRRPTLARLFGLPNDSGLVDHLQDNVDLSLLIRKTGQEKLSLIPCGKPPRNPSELLNSHRMIDLIHEMAERYNDRVILFDSPPDLVASETNILAKHVDGVVLVIRYGASRKEDVKKFVDILGTEKIIGVVFNAYPENTMETFVNKQMGYSYNDYYS